MQGQYSPTVIGWYSQDKRWFSKNGGGFGNGRNPESLVDDDGYDHYGYSLDKEGNKSVDRAGNLEDHYHSDYDLFKDTWQLWRRLQLPHL